MNQLQQEVITCLQSLKGSGKFATAHTAPFVLPGLEVAGAGPVSFPIQQSQAEALIKVAHKAPFGKGSDTVYDDSVRSAWEIDSDRDHV